MDHNEAVKLMITEKYLLDELSPEERDRFEEHFFGCTECADDVRAGALFIEKSKSVLGERPALVPDKTPAAQREKKGWLAWLRPAFTVPVMAALVAVIAYQNFARREQPQLLASASLNIAARGVDTPVITIRSGEGFLLFINIAPDSSYSSYVADMYDPGNKLEWSIKIPALTTQDQWPVQVPRANRKSGTYAIAVRGITPAGEGADIGRRSFEIQIEE
jgi:anti-sigma factor RsiW